MTETIKNLLSDFFFLPGIISGTLIIVFMAVVIMVLFRREKAEKMLVRYSESLQLFLDKWIPFNIYCSVLWVIILSLVSIL